jgi:hypothetical protein
MGFLDLIDLFLEHDSFGTAAFYLNYHLLVGWIKIYLSVHFIKLIAHVRHSTIGKEQLELNTAKMVFATTEEMRGVKSIARLVIFGVHDPHV